MAAATATPAALPAPAELPRPRTLLVGTAYATVATVMGFLALFGIYFSERAAAIIPSSSLTGSHNIYVSGIGWGQVIGTSE